jgi:hypothetical protein
MNGQTEWQEFRKEIEEAQKILNDHLPLPAAGESKDVLASALPSLLQQCREMSGLPGAGASRTMRSIHHFACTGGTLISRCIGAMANTQVLSEVDPLSTLQDARSFGPTDLIRLARLGTRPPDQEVLVKIFLAGLDVLFREARQTGADLVLRDHSHSQFCVGAEIPDRPTLRDMLKTEYRLHALVSVRHPLDSYLSLLKNGWNRFTPPGLEKYARRYMAFLDCYEGVEILRYENFVADPEAEMQGICEILSLSYNEDFQQIFPALHLSGDSGRKGSVISARPRRPVSEDLMVEVGQSATYASLCARLGYSPGP